MPSITRRQPISTRSTLYLRALLCGTLASGSCIRSSGVVIRHDAGADSQTDARMDGTLDMDSTRAAVLEVAQNVLPEKFARLRPALDQLVEATASLERSPTDAGARAATQLAWRQSMLVWQEIAAVAMGPLSIDRTQGGEDLASSFYAWPLGNSCRVDQEILRNQFSTLANFTVNARDLGALEYLVFRDETTSVCPAGHALQQPGQWDSLSANEVTVRRAAYAHAIAVQLQAQLSSLQNAWSAFTSRVAATGTDALFPTAGQALNALSDALFFFPHTVKDQKVGHPLGVVNCESGACSADVEHPFARISRDSVLAHVRGFRSGLMGSNVDAPSIVGLLRLRGHGEVADRLLLLVDQIEMQITALPPDLQVAIDTRRADVEAAHLNMRMLNALYRTELATCLDIELPMTAEGDND